LGQDFQATLWIGLDGVSEKGPMHNSALDKLFTHIV